MKTKMTRTIIGVLVGLILLSMSATAQAVLSTPNLLNDYNFASNSVLQISSGSLNSGQWYTSGSWSASSDIASLGNNKTGSLFQAVQVSTIQPSFHATPGPVKVSLDYSSSKLNTDTEYARLYGSNDRPSYGSYGTVLTSITNFAATAAATISTGEVTPTGTANAGYDWYTLVIYGSTGSGGAYFKVDNVSVQVTPVPAAVWLLGSGLIGLGILRRRRQA